jgi:hypothetical protein
MMTSTCRVMAYVSRECNLGIIYLSPMHIAERAIVGYKIQGTHLDLIDLTKRQRDAYRRKKLNDAKLESQSIYYAQ